MKTMRNTMIAVIFGCIAFIAIAYAILIFTPAEVDAYLYGGNFWKEVIENTHEDDTIVEGLYFKWQCFSYGAVCSLLDVINGLSA